MRVSNLLFIGLLSGSGALSLAQYGTVARDDSGTTGCSFDQDNELRGGVILRQYLSPDEQTVTIQMETQNQGYLAFAFSPSATMIGNTAVIGLPGSSTSPPVAFYSLNGYTVDDVQPLADDVAQLTDVSIVQNETGTFLTFTMPVKDPVSGDVMVTAGNPAMIIYAIGGDNTLSLHTSRGAAEVTFTACKSQTSENTSTSTTDSQPVAAPAKSPAASPSSSAAAPTAGTGSDASSSTCGVLQDNKLGNGVILRQYLSSDEQYVTIQMETQDQGYLAFAFSQNGAMIGSTAVIGLPDDTTNPVAFYYLGGYDVDSVQLLDSYQDQLTDTSIVQNDTGTFLTFTMPVKDPKTGTVMVTADNPTTVIYAIGGDNTLAVHSAKGSSDVTFTVCGQSDAAPAASPSASSPTSGTGSGGSSSECRFLQDDKLGKGVVLRQYMSSDEEYVTIQMEAQDQGYLAFAFSQNGDMVGSTAVIGLPDDTTNPVAFYYLGGYDMASIQLLESNQDQLTNTSVVQNDTGTFLTFTMPVKDPKTGTVMVTADTPTTVIYAIGGDNTLAVHAAKGSSDVTFTVCGQSGAGASPTTNSKPNPAPSAPVASPTSSSATAPTAGTGSSAGISTLAPGLTLFTQATADGLSAYFELTYEGQAWLGIGPSPGGGMVGGQVVIGIPGQAPSSTNPGKYSITSKSASGVTLMPSDQQTLKNATITMNDTHTVLSYITLLSPPNEIPISLTSPSDFIFGVGTTASTLVYHKTYNSLSLLVGGAVVGIGSDPRKIWVAHGVLLAVAWGILVPLAVLASVARDLVPLPPGMWFKMHQYLNSLAVLCTIAGFGCAIAAVNQQVGKGHHFTGPKHTRIGLAIFIIAILQVIFAVLRPHPPAPPKKPEEKEKPADDEENADDKDHSNGEHSEKSTLRFLWECKHRIVGLGCLALAWYNCYTGIDLFATKYGEEDDKTPAFWGVAASLGGLIVIGFVASKAMGKH